MYNFFEIFELEENYSLDKTKLEQKYLELQKKYHPDNSANPDQAKQFSKASSVINEAYKTLQDDFLRGAHILKLHNIDIQDDSNAPKLPLDILSEILEMQESLMEHPEQKPEIADKCKKQIEEVKQDLAELFTQKDYKKAAIRAMNLKYLAKMI